MACTFPEEALQHVLSFISSDKDRNSASLVCKSWYDIERWSRRHVFIGNCYAVSPPILIRRFSDVRSIHIKGKHVAADYDFVPEGWGAYALPWIAALVAAYPAMEEIRMKRMVVTDEDLELIGRKLKRLRCLVLRRCDGFSTDGLASIAANCRNLRMLDLSGNDVDDLGGNWIAHFPDSYTSLEFLNIGYVNSELHFSTLECLVGRCPNLKALRANHSYPLENLVSLLLKAPRLADLGIGLFAMEPCPEDFAKLANAFAGCKGLKSLSGLWDVNPYYLPAIYHVRDYIEDRGLEELAASCKDLQVLRVLPSDLYDTDPSIDLTEKGLVYVAMGCPKLHTIMYCCSQMTNTALLTIAKHRPNLTYFRLMILEPQLPDYVTDQPLDNGFSAIVERCKSLKYLLITGLVTDRLLKHIGTHGKKLEMLRFVFSESSDQGLNDVLSGCSNLRKLLIRDSPFSSQALLANSDRLEGMRHLWMSSCRVSYRECKLLAEKNPRLNVEIVDGKGPLHSMSDESLVEDLYIYRTVAGPRLDMPEFVLNAKQTKLLEKPRV